MKNLTSLFSDGDGQLSTMRVLAACVVIPIMAVWVVLSIKAGKMLPIDWSQIAAIAGAFGFKAVQSFAELANTASTAAKLPQPVPITVTPASGQSGCANVRLLSAFAAVTAAIGLALTLGCHSPTLNAGGVYAPMATNTAGTVTTNTDAAFFTAETTFWTAYSVMDAAFSAERANRAAYWAISPNIKEGLDAIRPEAWQVVQRYIAARRAYEAAPSTANLETLTGAGERITQLSATASSLLAPVSSTSTTK